MQEEDEETEIAAEAQQRLMVDGFIESVTVAVTGSSGVVTLILFHFFFISSGVVRSTNLHNCQETCSTCLASPTMYYLNMHDNNPSGGAGGNNGRRNGL